MATGTWNHPRSQLSAQYIDGDTIIAIDTAEEMDYQKAVRVHYERQIREMERQQRYYNVPNNIYYDSGNYFTATQATSHRCLVSDCKESHRDFHKGVLDYYKERHPEIAKKTECKNIMCHIEQIKRKI